MNKQRIILAISIAVGALGGYLYWKFVGCASGSCPITANWHMSTLVGAFFGYSIGDFFVPKKKNDETV